MLKKLAMAAAVFAAAGYAPAQAAENETGSAASRLQVAQVNESALRFNMGAVGKLLNTSSATKQIDASQVPAALEKREKARDMYQSAQAALAAGDLEKTAQLLTQVRATFFEAVRLAAPSQVTSKGAQVEYKNRVDSVKALLDAYKRIAAEKKSPAHTVTNTVAQIDKGLADADTLAQAGKYQEGRAQLDEAYLVAKVGITNLRSGDTLVRSLNFASKEDEYGYEIDRNNTHKLLVEMMPPDKRGSSAAQSFLAKAQDLRAQAEDAAKAKDYGKGVKLLEDSTSQLVRAVRLGGIFIPE